MVGAETCRGNRVGRNDPIERAGHDVPLGFDLDGAGYLVAALLLALVTAGATLALRGSRVSATAGAAIER